MRQIGTFTLTAGPEAEPLDLAAAKLHCRAEAASEDSLFESLITSARRYVENDTGLALIEQTWQATFNDWDERGLRLRPHPVSAVSKLEVWNGSGWTELDLAGFQFIAGRPALLLANDGTLPPTPMRSRGGIRVEFTAGFGAAGTDIPADILVAMKQLIAHWYENREPTAVSESLSVVGDIKFTVGAILANYRSLRLV